MTRLRAVSGHDARRPDDRKDMMRIASSCLPFPLRIGQGT